MLSRAKTLDTHIMPP